MKKKYVLKNKEDFCICSFCADGFDGCYKPSHEYLWIPGAFI